MLARVRGSVQGVQVSAPFGKVEMALEVFGNSRGDGAGNGKREMGNVAS
jgi:hypothetical protein